MRMPIARRVTTAAWTALLVLSASTAGGAEAPYSIHSRQAQRIHAELTFSIEAPKLTATDWVVVVAKPPKLESQYECTASLDPSAVPHVEVGGLGRTVLRARVPVAKGGAREKRLDAKASFDAVLYARTLVRGRTPGLEVPTLAKSERDAALRRTAMYDFATAPFPQWLDDRGLRRRKTDDDVENDVDLGRRIFQAVVGALEYEYRSELQRNVSYVCTHDKSDCGGMVMMFVGALRANGVPARALVGCWAKSSEPAATVDGERYFQTHVKAEFFAEGVGWVPVDLSSAVLHDRTPEKLEFFGNDPGDFLTLHVDPELRVDSVHFGPKTLTFLQQFSFFVRGKGTLDDLRTEMDWKVRSVKFER